MYENFPFQQTLEALQPWIKDVPGEWRAKTDKDLGALSWSEERALPQLLQNYCALRMGILFASMSEDERKLETGAQHLIRAIVMAEQVAKGEWDNADTAEKWRQGYLMNSVLVAEGPQPDIEPRPRLIEADTSSAADEEPLLQAEEAAPPVYAAPAPPPSMSPFERSEAEIYRGSLISRRAVLKAAVGVSVLGLAGLFLRRGSADSEPTTDDAPAGGPVAIAPTQPPPLPTSPPSPTPTPMPRPAPGTVLFQSDWKTQNWPSKGWSLVNGMYVSDIGGRDFQPAPFIPPVADYAVEVVAVVGASGALYIVARSDYTYSIQDLLDVAVFEISPGPRSDRLPFKREQLHTYRFEVNGGSLRGLMDGKEMISAIDSRYKAPGKLGFFAGGYTSKVSVQSMRVIAL